MATNYAKDIFERIIKREDIKVIIGDSDFDSVTAIRYLLDHYKHLRRKKIILLPLITKYMKNACNYINEDFILAVEWSRTKWLSSCNSLPKKALVIDHHNPNHTLFLEFYENRQIKWSLDTYIKSRSMLEGLCNFLQKRDKSCRKEFIELSVYIDEYRHKLWERDIELALGIAIADSNPNILYYDYISGKISQEELINKFYELSSREKIEKVKNIANNARIVRLGKYKVAIVHNIEDLALSEGASFLLANREDIDIVLRVYGNENSITGIIYRGVGGEKRGINIANIARKLGGGGKPSAGGWQNPKPLSEVLKVIKEELEA